MYKAYITTIKNVRKHPNADRLQLGECFGNTVCVDLSYRDNQLGVYFPTDGQLSTEFAEANNLLRKKDAEGNNVGGYMDPDKRNIRAIKLRGEKSDGLFLPLKSLESFGDISTLKAGDTVDVFNGHEICRKYFPRTNQRQRTRTGNKTRKKTAPIAPLFMEHADTEQLNYNLPAFRTGDKIEITLKLHGSSQRTGYLPVLKGYKRTWKDRLFRREGTPIYDWGYVSGTRRTVLEDYEDGYSGENEFREPHSKFFEGKLHKGEEVFYEVVGFTTNGTPIMPPGDNRKVDKANGDKSFSKQYGPTTVFSYGCDPKGYTVNSESPVPQSDFYVYRMTVVNEDGDVVEYSPDTMRYRCEQMGAKCVPVLYQGFLVEPENWAKETWNAGEYAKMLAEEYYDGPDPIGRTHVREGVVVRIVNRPKFTAYKTKNFSFKVLEGIIKESSNAPDIEEQEELQDPA